MKDLIEILTNEEKSFNFKWWVYAIICPIGLMILMAIAGWMDKMSGV